MKNKDMLWTLSGIALMALLIFSVWRSRNPDPIVFTPADQPEMSAEHEFVQEALVDVESIAAAEDAALSEAPTIVRQEVLPVPGQPLPVNWDSQPAPEAGSVELSPALQRSLANSAHLRTEAYINPNSEYNLRTTETLRETRKSRQEASE